MLPFYHHRDWLEMGKHCIYPSIFLVIKSIYTRDVQRGFHIQDGSCEADIIFTFLTILQTSLHKEKSLCLTDNNNQIQSFLIPDIVHFFIFVCMLLATIDGGDWEDAAWWTSMFPRWGTWHLVILVWNIFFNWQYFILLSIYLLRKCICFNSQWPLAAYKTKTQ